MARVEVPFSGGSPLRAWAWSAALLALSGCWSRDRFEAEGIDQLCEQASACSGSFEPGRCAEVLAASSVDCEYDSQMASDCAVQLEHAQCAAQEPFDVPALEIPASCDRAFRCKGEDWLAALRVE